MSDANPRDQSSNVKARPPENDRIVIALPYAIANMVFIQSLPFWILGILGAIGFCYGFVVLGLGKALDQAVDIWTISAVCTVLAVAGLLVLKQDAVAWALEGRSTAITVLYVFHAVGVVIGPLLAASCCRVCVPAGCVRLAVGDCVAVGAFCSLRDTLALRVDESLRAAKSGRLPGWMGVVRGAESGDLAAFDARRLFSVRNAGLSWCLIGAP